MNEQTLHRAVVAHLEAHGVPGLIWLHVNNNPRSARDGARLKRMGLRAGAPDMLYFCRGHFFAHEFKTENGKLSWPQHEFMVEFRQAGGIGFVTYGLNEAIKTLHEFGLCRGKVQ